MHVRAFLAVAVFTVLFSAVSARTFRCNEVWSSASQNNSVGDCFTNATHAQSVYTDQDHLPHVIYALIPMLFFILGFFGCPMVCCGRYVCKCCGGCRRTPDKGCFACGSEMTGDDVTEEQKNAMYPLSAVRNTKVCATVIMVLGFAMLIVAVVGTTLLNETYVRVFTETKSVLGWVDTQALSIRTVLTINATGELIPPLTSGFFDNITKTVNDFRIQIDDTKASADPYVENVNIAALCIGVVPLVFLILTVVAAVCDIRSGLLCCNLCCHCVVLIPYTILAFLFLIIALVMGDVCGERQLFLENATNPGLFSLALVPLCSANAPFDSAKADVRAVINEQAISACTNMQRICDHTGVYQASEPSRVYDCGDLNTPSTDCPTFIAANRIGNTFTLKNHPSIECRYDLNDATTSFTPCNISMCASHCVIEGARNASQQIVTNLLYASNGEYAFNEFVSPLLDCNIVYAQALRPFVVCPEFVASMQLVGGSFFGYSFLFLIGMCAICRGQKRFFKPPKEEQSDSDLEIDRTDEFDDLSKAHREPAGN